MLGPSGGVRSGANPLPGDGNSGRTGSADHGRGTAGQGKGRAERERSAGLAWTQGVLEPEGGPSGRWPFVPGDPGAGLSVH